MAIGDKPTDLPQWADDGAAQITVPSAGKRTLGWIREKPPFQFFNWFWNLVYQWIAWAKTYGETHTHDGGAGDHSAPKISLVGHVAWGDHGEVEVITDTPAEHEIGHIHLGAGNPSFNTGVMKVRNIRIRNASNDRAEIEDESTFNDVRLIRFKTVVAGSTTGPAGTSSDMYRPVLGQPSGGNVTTLFPHDQTQYLKNLLKVTMRARFTTTTPSAVPPNTVEDSYNVSGNFVSGPGAGEFQLSLQSATAIDGVITPTIEAAGTDAKEYRTRNTRLSGSAIITEIEWNNAGTWSNLRTNPPVDADFIINIHAS